jgi:cytochrome c oxidase accessory protein FixG
MSKQITEQESFRDSISTVDKDGKRIWIYPKKPKGTLHNYRIGFTIGLLALLFSAPFVRIAGQPLILFNVLQRKFVIFGQLFQPQDLHLFVFGMLLFFIFIVVFTMAFGRVWCGWACPQTIFMEMVFRKVEYWIEGDAAQQRKLNAAPWNVDKIIKKASKISIFIFISFLIANLLLAYIIGTDELGVLVTDSPFENLDVLLPLLAFTVVFFSVFTFIREQACTTICPYGRLQGVLLVKESIVVAYDFIRGEPRGRIKRKRNKKANESPKEDVPEEKQGDCIDCNLCVEVCPTGIDIRNGTQLECVNCTACIDACDSIMDKIKKPHGLIRYASEEEIAENKPFHFTTKLKVYSGIMVILIVAMVSMLLLRNSVETTVLRALKQTYVTTETGNIRNVYTIQFINKTHEDKQITIHLLSPKGDLKLVQGNEILLKAEGIANGAMLVELSPENISGAKTELVLEIRSDGEPLETIKTSFLGPMVIK